MTEDLTALRGEIRQEMEEALPMLRDGPPKDWRASFYEGNLDHHLGKLQSLCSTATSKIDLKNYTFAPVWYWFRKEYWAGGEGPIYGGCVRIIEVAPSLKVLQAYRRYAYPRTSGPSMQGLALLNKSSPVAVMLQPLKHFGKQVQVVHEKLGPIGC